MQPIERFDLRTAAGLFFVQVERRLCRVLSPTERGSVKSRYVLLQHPRGEKTRLAPAFFGQRINTVIRVSVPDYQNSHTLLPYKYTSYIHPAER